MDKRPYSEEDIERLKKTGYVSPKPLHPILIIFLTFAFPLGALYIVNKAIIKRLNAGYMLSKCTTDAQREKLFARLRKSNPFNVEYSCSRSTRGHDHPFSQSNTYSIIDPRNPLYYSSVNVNRHKSL